MGDNRPNALRLFRDVELTEMYSSVCSHKGKTYLGRQDGSRIVRLDEANAVVDVVTVTKEEIIQAFTVYKDKIYALISPKPKLEPHTSKPQPPKGVEEKQPPSEVRVYALDGNRVEREGWTHTDGAGSRYQLTISDDWVVLLNLSTTWIYVYSLDGEVARLRFVCPELLQNSRGVFMCAAAADSRCVVVSDSNSSKVFKLDLTTGQFIGVPCTAVSNPQGVTCDKNKHILVTDQSRSPTTVYIPNFQPG